MRCRRLCRRFSVACHRDRGSPLSRVSCLTARLTIDVQVSEPGVALIPARLLADTVKSLSDAPVDVETDQSQARIRCAAYEGALRLLPAEDFPGLQEPGGTRVEADAGAFAEAVSQVARAASRDE